MWDFFYAMRVQKYKKCLPPNVVHKVLLSWIFRLDFIYFQFILICFRIKRSIALENTLLTHTIIYFHFIATIVIIILPSKKRDAENLFEDINKIIKKYAFCITLVIRTFYVKSMYIILTEYRLYYIIVKRGGVLRLFSHILENGFNTSGHLFLFSFSCYIFMRCLLLYDTWLNLFCMIGFIVYFVLGLITVMYYHRKAECLLSTFVSFLTCLLHDYLIEL